MNIQNQFIAIFETFKRNSSINILGSTAYIALKLIFYVFLYKSLNPTQYGAMGYFFSYIFLMVNIASAPILYLPAHAYIYQKEKKRISTYFAFFIGIQILLLTACIFFFLHMIQTVSTVQELLTFYPLLPYIASAIIMGEGIRLLLRFFMHIINKTKVIVPLELLSMLCYLGIVFILLEYSSIKPLYAIFIPFLIDSVVITFIFSKFALKWFLEEGAPSSIEILSQASSKKQLSLDSLAHALSYYAQALLSDNMIIVSFVPVLGLKNIAIPKFTAYIAESFTLLVKSLVKFSMIPAFSQLLSHSCKEEDKDAKRAASALLMHHAQKLFFIITAITFFSIFSVTLYSYVYPLHEKLSHLESPMILIVAFFMAKYLDQWSFFYEKIILLHQRPYPIIGLSILKISCAGILFMLKFSLTKILFILILIKALSTLFSYFYTKTFLNKKIIS